MKPFLRGLQTVATAAWLVCFVFGGPFGILFCFYLLQSNYWWFPPLYAFWIYIDRVTCETGGRTIKWVKNLTWWYHVKQYYPSHLTHTPNFYLNPKKNYLFCCFPHGIVPSGPFSTLVSGCSEFAQLYPNFMVKPAILHFNFFLPFVRELNLSMGCVSVSARSIDYVLSRPEGGQVLLLWPGGAVEAFCCKPKQYKFVVNARKGFIKMALKNGTPLVPVITFGETDLFEQVEGPVIRKVQEAVRKYTGVAPVLVKGRGFFQEYFGIIPRRKRLNTVLGKPIDVEKVSQPNKKQIDKLHQFFVKELINLFNEYKYKYLEDPQNTYLELE